MTRTQFVDPLTGPTFGTAHEVAADWSWMTTCVGFTVGRSRVVWDEACYGRGSLVRISRLVASPGGIRQVVRYIQPRTPIYLVGRRHA